MTRFGYAYFAMLAIGGLVFVHPAPHSSRSASEM